MANNYSAIAEEFLFPKAAAKDFEKIANAVMQDNDDGFPDWMTEEDKSDLSEAMGCFSLSDISYSNGRLYIGEEENADIDATGTILSMVMRHHDIREVIPLHASFTCSKLRPGEFGGAMCAVGPEGVRFLDENAFLKSVRGELLGEKSPQEAWNEHLDELRSLSDRFNDLTGCIPQMFLSENLKDPCAFAELEGQCYVLSPGRDGTWAVSEVASAEALLVSDEVYLVQDGLDFDGAMAKFLEKLDCDVTLENLREESAKNGMEK